MFFAGHLVRTAGGQTGGRARRCVSEVILSDPPTHRVAQKILLRKQKVTSKKDADVHVFVIRIEIQPAQSKVDDHPL